MLITYIISLLTHQTSLWLSAFDNKRSLSSSTSLFYFYYTSEAVCPLSSSDFGISEEDLKACLQSVSSFYSTHSTFKGILYVQVVFLLLQYGHLISDSSDLDFYTSVLCHTNYK